MDQEQLFDAIKNLRAIKEESPALAWTLTAALKGEPHPAHIRLAKGRYIALVEIAFKFTRPEALARWSIDYIFMPGGHAHVTIHPIPIELTSIDTTTSRILYTWEDHAISTNGGTIRLPWHSACTDALCRIYRFKQLVSELCNAMDDRIVHAYRTLPPPAKESA